MENKKIIFYDGFCNLCDGFVKTVINLDKRNIFLFAPLNGNHAKNLLKDIHLYSGKSDSVIFYDNKEISFKSKAVIEILLSLKGFFYLFWFAKLIPSFLSNIVYDVVAKNRYVWFGKQDKCIVPDKKIRSKFLD
tara:strand:- start:186 stop:587 length:402 start_codon:yes stop_codon:yes gene_type:complete